MDIDGQLLIGPSGGSAGTVNLSSGTLNSDGTTIGNGLLIGGTMNQSGGTHNITGNLLLNTIGNYTCSNSPAINITGNFANNNLLGGFTAASSIVTFNGASGTQTISTNSVATQAFYDVAFSNPGQVTVGGNINTLTVNDDLSIAAGSFNTGTAANINVAGDWTNNGTSFIPGSGRVTFNGSAAQVINGSTVTTFNNFTLNNSNNLSLSGVNASITGGAGSLTLSNGKINTGTNKIILGNTATIANAGTARYINGNLQMGIPVGASTKTFEIGSSTNYAPVTLTFSGIASNDNVTGYTVDGDHPGILLSQLDEDASVNRYWNFSNTGASVINYNATFNFQTADVDAGATTSLFSVGKYGPAWSYCNVTARTANSITVSALGSLGEFAVAEAGAGAPFMTVNPANQTVCSGSGSSITASAHSKPYSTVQWQISTDGGVTYSALIISSPYTVSQLNAGAVSYSTLTINPTTTSISGYMYKAVFTNSRGTVTSNASTYTVIGLQTVNAGPALNPICKGGTSDPLGGSVAGSATSATWSSSVAGGTFNPNATTLNATWTPPATYTGTATLTLTTSNGTCPAVSANKTLVVSNTATANAGTALAAICQGSNSAGLGGSVGGTATGGIWSTPSGGTFNPNATTLNATWTPPVGFYGTVTFTLTATGSACTATATKNLTVNQVATADAGLTLNPICQGGTSDPLGGSIGGAATSGTWSTPAGGTFNPNATTLNATWTPPAGYTGTATLTLTTSGGSCGAVTDSKTQIVNFATANAGGALTAFCQGGTSAPLGGFVSGTATGGTWSTSAGGTFNPNATTLNATWTPPAAYSGTATLILTTTGGSCNGNASKTQVVNPVATVSAGPALSPVCQGASSAPLGGTIGGAATSGTWTTPAGGTFNPNATTLNATWTPPAGYFGSAVLTLTTTGGVCGAVTDSKTQVVNIQPGAVTITPSSATLCQLAIQSMTASNATTASLSSGAINLAIPDNSATGVTSTLAISGIPATAVITSVTINFNVTHSKDNQLVLNIKAPNGNVLNMANLQGGANANFTNTTVSSIGTNTFTAGSAPFTGTFIADAVNAVGATGNVSNVASFASLIGPMNGNWTISAKDALSGQTGTLNSWTMTINYRDAITWTPLTDLYTDAAATIAYTGQNLQTVYAKPATGGSPVYTATASNGTCSSPQNITLTVNPKPVVTITADYCYGGGKIQLTANSTPAGATWLWNTGAATQSILVDVAGNFIVTVTSAAGCIGTGNTIVAQELITNGDFSAGNVGFTSTYNYTAPTSGSMYPANLYTVYSDPTFTHNTFFGRDHTSNTGNFMIINGSGTVLPVWAETVNVQPNTDYYFSAWAISLNSVAPYANLQFKVNGVQVGTTTGTLPARPHNNNPPYNWTRFYGIWNSGAATTANVTIIDLEPASNGNDFGIDDISFATLSTFIKLTAPAGTDSQTVCKNTAINNITYNVGSGSAGPTVTGLPPGVTSSFNGLTLTISGTPTTAGTYNFTITTTGTCNPTTAYGRIIVQEQTISLTSAAATTSQILCVNRVLTSITYSVGGTATGATVTGLPPGVNGSFSSGVFSIGGTPNTGGIYNYTVTTTGTCTPVTATGTITVNAQAISLASAVGTNAQTVCLNTNITSITYNVTGSATNATVSGLPLGVTGTYNAGVFTIAGAPRNIGIYTYTVTTSGSCSPVATATGTITVTQQSISLSSAIGTDAQAACINVAITNITYSVTGSATNASVTGLPSGVTGIYNTGVFTISGTPTASGTFNYTVTTSGTCSPAATATGTITISSASVGGTVASVSICSGGSGNVTLTGNVGTIVRWESSANGGTTWTNIANTGTTQSYTSLTQAVLYRALVKNGTCGASVYSTAGKVGIHNLWTGITSSDWNTATNWSDDQVADLTCINVTIPAVISPAVYPQLTNGVGIANNLVINTNATVTISTGTLRIKSAITNNGTLDVSNGILELNGTSGVQTIAGSMFVGHYLKDLKISNTNGISLSGTNDTLKLTGLLSFSVSNAVFATNNNLTLKSSATATAGVGDLTNAGVNSGNNITGNVTVERYIPNHPKAWQFMAVPTTGQTINNAWQEANSTLANSTHPGYGTIITSNVSGAVGWGFDVYTPTGGPSMKTYNPSTQNWDGVASTALQIANKKGYMFFVRGDRSITTSTAPATATILRTTGKLYTFGADAPPVTTVLAGKAESIGNPYASAIDFRLITKPAAPAVSDLFYVWDPLLTNNANGLGGYQTISASNGWKPIPGGTANYDATVVSPYIQSGQAFLVSATSGAGGSVSFTEQCKVNTNKMIFRQANNLSGRQFLHLNLFNAANILADGNVVAFDDNFDNDINTDDAIKIANTSENIGIKRNGTTFALEARKPVVAEDTIFYTFNTMKLQNYRLQFTPENMSTPGLTAVLADRFLSTTTPISLTDTSSVNFQITTNAGSYAQDRFYVIFKTSAVVLPVTITRISATRNNNKTVKVDWNVESETSMRNYEVEHSADGRSFTKLDEAQPKANNGGTAVYSRIDENPLPEDNFYRIKAISNSGLVQYSSIVKVARLKTQPGIEVYPNPVTDKKINIQFSSQPKGTYQVELINAAGQSVYKNTIELSGSNSTQSIQPDKTIAAGNYKLKITAEDGTANIKQLIIR